MRLWSIHPQYLDSKGLVAVWREGLLAKKVLEGKTKGYTQHPQLIRFRNHTEPLDAINYYLFQIFTEANQREYQFDGSKISIVKKDIVKIPVNLDQVEYEFLHLKNKLQTREPSKYETLNLIQEINIHPLFEAQEGAVEDWEIIKNK